MKALVNIIRILGFIFLISSCTFGEQYDLSTDSYKVTYNVETSEDASVTKIKYTDVSGETVLLTEFDVPWTIQTIAHPGQTVKLEVYGDVQGDEINMGILAKGNKNIIERFVLKEKSDNM